jgi:hypothetical protein
VTNIIPLTDAPGRLAGLAEQLGVYAGWWASRDTADDKPTAIRAGTSAMAAIDEMLAVLHSARAQLVSERRADQDRVMAESAALLARLEGRVSELEECDELAADQLGALSGRVGALERGAGGIR